jgi:hypothetical protein
MRKQQQAELRRLEEALMAEEYREEAAPDIDESWQEYADREYEIYNADDTDVDMDAYSEDVQAGKPRNSAGVLVVLTVVLLAAVIALLLKFLEVV